MRIKKIMSAKHLAQFLAHDKSSIDSIYYHYDFYCLREGFKNLSSSEIECRV